MRLSITIAILLTAHGTICGFHGASDIGEYGGGNVDISAEFVARVVFTGDGASVRADSGVARVAEGGTAAVVVDGGAVNVGEGEGLGNADGAGLACGGGDGAVAYGAGGGGD
mmetsp:Transcript_17387/g.29369  ORF Transcript_17387/g.29369 Transcript_17387/m.29369 type:complete len:112 (+) Transcript_17387:340-675(+)